MKGRITSNPSHHQRRIRLNLTLRAEAWRLVDLVMDRLSPSSIEPSASGGSGIKWCVLHVGFISIIETEAQIARLRNEPLSFEISPARSRIMKRIQTHAVSPIDATAALVAGGTNGR